MAGKMTSSTGYFNTKMQDILKKGEAKAEKKTTAKNTTKKSK